nr:hypothetical protein [Tanacetum cinerariifolium]
MLVVALNGRAHCYYIIPLNMLVFPSLFDVCLATATNERPLEQRVERGHWCMVYVVARLVLDNYVEF